MSHLNTVRNVRVNKDLLNKADLICQEFDGRASESHLQFRKKIQIQPCLADFENYYQLQDIVVEDGIAFNIPESKIQNFLEAISTEKLNEIYLREKYPALRIAWEKYMMLVGLLGNDNHGY